MLTLLNPWLVALTWGLVMTIVWTLFVPGSLSVATFVFLAATGLLFAVVFAPVLRSSITPKLSVAELLKSESATAPTRQ
jgi:hypothetical protein